MKKLFHSGLLAFALICGFAVFTGCQTATEQTLNVMLGIRMSQRP